MPTDPLTSGIIGALIGALATNFVRQFLERRSKTSERKWEARERVSQKLAVILNPYTAAATRTPGDVERLRSEWATEGYLLDILHDPALGRDLNRIVTDYLDAVVQVAKGTFTAINLQQKRSDAWRDARARLEKYVSS